MNTDEIDQRRALCIAVLAVCACVIDLCIFSGYLYHVLRGVKCTAVIQTVSVMLLHFSMAGT